MCFIRFITIKHNFYEFRTFTVMHNKLQIIKKFIIKALQ